MSYDMSQEAAPNRNYHVDRSGVEGLKAGNRGVGKEGPRAGLRQGGRWAGQSPTPGRALGQGMRILLSLDSGAPSLSPGFAGKKARLWAVTEEGHQEPRGWGREREPTLFLRG